MQISKLVLGFGVALAILAVLVGLVAFPELIKYKIRSQIRLEEGGDLFKRWVDIPVPIYMKVYFFNVTNPDDVKIGQKPVLEQMGPYVYQQKRQRIVENIDTDADTIDFRPKITYTFRRDMSAGPEDDVVTVLDIPFVSAATKAAGLSVFSRSLVRDIILSYDHDVFMRKSVRELLFKGFEVPMMKELGDLQGAEILPNNTFGIFYGKNGTAGDLLKIYSGVKDSTVFGSTLSWNGVDKLDFWEENEYCNMINGSDGSVFPPFVTRDRILRIFSPDMCRSIYMTYLEDVEVLGVPGFRFISPKDLLQDPRINPENECYCEREEEDDDLSKCLKAGVFSLSPCKKGAPVVISWPHFFDGDESYVEQSIGLEPEKDLHETFIVLEPNTGSLIKASKRFQINIKFQPIKLFKVLKKVPNMIMPILWVDESVQLNEDNAAMINSKLMKPMHIAAIGTWSVLGTGLLIALIGSLLVFRDGKNSESYKAGGT